MSVKIHQSLYVSAALAQWGFHIGDVGGCVPGRSGHVWFQLLILCLSGPSEAAASRHGDLQFPYRVLFMLALINSPYICNET